MRSNKEPGGDPAAAEDILKNLKPWSGEMKMETQGDFADDMFKRMDAYMAAGTTPLKCTFETRDGRKFEGDMEVVSAVIKDVDITKWWLKPLVWLRLRKPDMQKVLDSTLRGIGKFSKIAATDGPDMEEGTNAINTD